MTRGGRAAWFLTSVRKKSLIAGLSCFPKAMLQIFAAQNTIIAFLAYFLTRQIDFDALQKITKIVIDLGQPVHGIHIHGFLFPGRNEHFAVIGVLNI